MIKYIESLQNPKIKLVRSLHQNKGRADAEAFIVEGQINEIPNNWEIKFYLVSQTFIQKFGIYKYEQRANIFVADDKTFAYACDTMTPQGILAVCSKSNAKISEKIMDELLKVDNPLFLLMENTQDPGNLGTVIRTADAAGVTAVFISNGSVDAFNPKVVRSAAGSIFNLPFFVDIDIVDIVEKLMQNRINVYAASLDGATDLYSLDLSGGCAFIIGNEARGLSIETIEHCSKAVKIPILGKAESLNASMACGILLYEAVRQRHY